MPKKFDYNVSYSVLYEKNSLCRLLTNLPHSFYLDIIYRNIKSGILYDFTVININWQKFKQENNQTLKNLSELNIDEKYLIDIINGEMYHYDPDNSLLWSVSKNGTNNEATEDDIVLDLNTGVIGYK